MAQFGPKGQESRTSWALHFPSNYDWVWLTVRLPTTLGSGDLLAATWVAAPCSHAAMRSFPTQSGTCLAIHEWHVRLRRTRAHNRRGISPLFSKHITGAAWRASACWAGAARTGPRRRLCRAQRDALALAHAPADCAACATLTLTDRAARSSSLTSLKKTANIFADIWWQNGCATYGEKGSGVWKYKRRSSAAHWR